MCPEAEEIAQKYTVNTTTSTNASSRKLITGQLTKYLSNSNSSSSSSTIHQHHQSSNNPSRTLSPKNNQPVNSKGFQFTKDKSYQTLREGNRINIPQRPLSKLNNQSNLNLCAMYKNNSHHYSSSNINANMSNANKTNYLFDLNKIDMKSTRIYNGEKRLPVLTKNASMKFLNVNPSYLSNLNL